MICENLVPHIESTEFENKFYPHLVELSKDKVPNVRFIVARIFTQQLLGNGKHSHFSLQALIYTDHATYIDAFPATQAELQEIIEGFSSDTDREVRFYSQTS